MLNMVCKYKSECSKPDKGARFYIYSFSKDGSKLYYKSFASKAYALKYLDKYVGDMEDRINDLYGRRGMRPISLDGERFRFECSRPFWDEPYYAEEYEWKRG